MSRKETKLGIGQIIVTIIVALVLVLLTLSSFITIKHKTSIIEENYGESVINLKTEYDKDKDGKTIITNHSQTIIIGDLCEEIITDAAIARNISYATIGALSILFLVLCKIHKLRNWRETTEGAKEILEEELVRVAGEKGNCHTLCDLLKENKFSDKVLISAAIRAAHSLITENLEAIIKLGPLEINTLVPLKWGNTLELDSKGSLLHCIAEDNYWIQSAADYIAMIERMKTLGINLSIRDLTYCLTAFEMFGERCETFKNRMENGKIAKICELLKPEEVEKEE